MGQFWSCSFSSSDGLIVAISAPNNEGDLTSVPAPIGTITNETIFITKQMVIIVKYNPTESVTYTFKKGINPGSIRVFQNNGSSGSIRQ